MLVILEGPDGSGKTTLAKAIQKRYPWYEYLHVGPPTTKNPYLEYHKMLQEVRPDTILDRAFYGERVYGPLYRKKSGVTRAELLYLELLALSASGLQEPLMVYCTGNKADLIERCAAKGTSYDSRGIKHVNQILDGFQNVLQHETTLSWIWYDSTSNSICPAAFVGMNQRFQYLSNRNRHLGGVGQCRSPRLCLVGDQLSGSHRLPEPGSCMWLELPYRNYRPFDRGPASEFLLDSLLTAGYKATDLYIVNSRSGRTESWEAQLELELTAIGPKRIVALGKWAALRLKVLGLEHAQIPHPQYWRRFHWRQRQAYAAMLREPA